MAGPKILLFRKALTQEGGAERLLLEVAKNMRASGINARVVVAKSKGMDKLFNGQYADVPVMSFWSGAYPENILAKLLISFRTVRRLRRAIREFGPDAITASNQADAEAMFLATLGTKFRYSVFIPGSLFCFPDESLKYAGPFRKAFHKIRDSLAGHKEFIPLRRPDRNPLTRPLLALRAWFQYWSVRKAVLIFCHSRRMAWELEQLYGHPAVDLKCGAEPALLGTVASPDIRLKYRVPPEGKMLFDASRLVVGKREALSIRAVAMVRKERDDVYLVVGGKGPEKEDLERLVAELNIGDRVNLAGYVPEEDLPRLYASADVILHPAWIDFDITVMEGLSFGKKVICSTEYDVSGELSRLKERQIFQAEPTAEGVRDAIGRALAAGGAGTAEVKEVLEHYTWRAYADALASRLLPSTR